MPSFLRHFALAAVASPSGLIILKVMMLSAWERWCQREGPVGDFGQTPEQT
jgi:hypothetical protein